MDQQFSLSWNNFHGNLSKGFAGLLGKGEFVDVTIAVEGHLLQAHKVILSICSPYFKKMFQMNPCQHPIVVLRDVTHKAMKDLLQFMYHGEVSVKREDLTSFIGTAEVLQIKGLTNKETEDEGEEQEETLPKSETEKQNCVQDAEPSITEPLEPLAQDQPSQNHQQDFAKQRELIERLQKLSNLKRKSEEFLHKNYYSTDIFNVEKRLRLKDKATYKQHSMIDSNNYENFRKVFQDTPMDATFNSHCQIDLQNNKTDIMNKDMNDTTKMDQIHSGENSMEIKTECEDSEIIVTDPAVCSPPKSYDSSKETQRDPMDFSTQDNCGSLNSLFMDLKNLVNGKTSHEISRNSGQEYPLGVMEHRLVTIPQKEDGKKKYPQRSCRLCWKIGKRRDTRFMCSACELPFCKTPCFEIHYNNVLKATQMHGDYYAV